MKARVLRCPVAAPVASSRSPRSAWWWYQKPNRLATTLCIRGGTNL